MRSHPNRPNRRRFLQVTAGGALLGLGDFGFLRRLPAVSAEEVELNPKLVRLSDDIEPLVRVLETTSRDQLLETVAARIKEGASYREILAALLLAGVRNVQPRPSVGFKFHSVLVVNSAHLASLASADQDRWLPIFWALDYWKRTQLEEERTSGWKLGPVEERAVPPARRARRAFTQAMENWDPPAADAAVAALARSAGANELFEIFCRFGARDFRSIGHKAIYVANSWRTLQAIGWHHAEPVLRSLAYALLNHTGDPNPAESDQEADRPWRRNQELLGQIRRDWRNGEHSEEGVQEMLATLRTGTNDDACDKAVELLNRGVSPQSIWDAILIGSGEVLMRQPGIVGLHTLTTANALYYAAQTSGNDETRRLLLLQNCAFLPMFREAARGRGRLAEKTISDLQPEMLSSGSAAEAMEEIFADVSRDRTAAARKVLGFLDQGGDAGTFMDAARKLIFLKGNDSHDYKFSSAVLEDYDHVSPRWKSLFLALSVYNLTGSGERDNGLVERTREALNV